MKFRRHLPQETGVNLTPLIDVVFLLLIFFMVSTTFSRETHLSIDLPEAQGEPPPPGAERVEILIDPAGRYAVNRKLLPEGDAASLKAAIREAAGGNVSLPLAITADARAPHEAVVRAMDAAGQAGFARLGITTLRPARPQQGP